MKIATQLSEMTLGVREKFDPAAIGMQVVSTLAAVQIADKISNVGLSVPAGKVAIIASNLVVNSTIAAATHTPVNVQQAAMQAISGMVADEARSYVQNRTETTSFVNDYEKPELVNIAKPTLVVPKPAYGEVSYAMGVLNQARMANEHASSKHNGSTSYAMSELNQAKMNQSQRAIDSASRKRSTPLSLQQPSSQVDASTSLMMAANNASGEPYSAYASATPLAKASMVGVGLFAATQVVPAAVLTAAATVGNAVASATILGSAAEAGMLLSMADAASLQVVAGVGGLEVVGGGVVASLGLFGKASAVESTSIVQGIGLTSRLNRSQIKSYLSNVHTISRDKLIQDLESIGLKFNGSAKDGRFMSFIDKQGNVRINLHPADRVTQYDHMHMYTKQRHDLSAELLRVDYRSSDAHIQIKSDNLNYSLEYYNQKMYGRK
jgi:hypothetical protein